MLKLKIEILHLSAVKRFASMWTFAIPVQSQPLQHLNKVYKTWPSVFIQDCQQVFTYRNSSFHQTEVNNF